MTSSSEGFADQTLCLAIASHYSELAQQRWRKLMTSSQLPWTELATLSGKHGLAPLLYAAVASGPAIELPDEIHNELKRQYQLTATMNMLAMHDLEQIILCLNESGVRTILLKGAALLEDVYENQALRPMVDLDILISFADLPLALQSLAGIDYTNPEPAPFANTAGLYWNEVLLRSSNRTSAQLELHWNLLDNPYYASRFNIASLFQRAMPVKIGAQPTLALSPEDLLLHLSAHNLYHHRGMLRRTDVDLAFVAHRYRRDIDWTRFINSAVSNDMVLGAQQSLTRAADCWHAPVPQDTLRELSDHKPKLRERFWATCQRSEFLKLFRTFATLPAARYRWGFLRGQLLPSREYLYWRYGTPLSTPAPLAYTRRYLSGVGGLMAELRGRTREKQRQKNPNEH